MDLTKIISDTMTKLDEERYIEVIVEDRLKRTISDVVDSTLNTYSEFGKELKEKVKEELEINFDRLKLPTYNHMILNMIQEELQHSLQENGVSKVQENVERILGAKASEPIKLSDLIKDMVEDELEDKLNELDYDEIHEITVEVDDEYSLVSISFDPDAGTPWYSCKYRIVVDSKTNELIRATVNKKEITTTSNKEIMGGIYGVEETLFDIWTTGTKIIIDDDYTVEYHNPNYED